MRAAAVSAQSPLTYKHYSTHTMPCLRKQKAHGNMSAQDGIVTFAGNSGGYGNVVVIENEHGIITKYAHANTILVSVGQTVKMGDIIATVGSTGNSTWAHLHFELLKDGLYLNPLYFADTGSTDSGSPLTPDGTGTVVGWDMPWGWGEYFVGFGIVFWVWVCYDEVGMSV